MEEAVDVAEEAVMVKEVNAAKATAQTAKFLAAMAEMAGDAVAAWGVGTQRALEAKGKTLVKDKLKMTDATEAAYSAEVVNAADDTNMA